MDLIDLYQGAYGRTIRLATDEEATLQALRKVFLQLARGRRGPFELGETIFPRVDRRTRIKIYAALIERERRKTLAEEPAANPPTFRWRQSKDGWRQCAYLVKGLLQGSGRGHQYLTTEGVDDALIELAYRE